MSDETSGGGVVSYVVPHTHTRLAAKGVRVKSHMVHTSGSEAVRGW